MSANEGYSLQILQNTASLSSALSHWKSFAIAPEKSFSFFYHNLDLDLILFFFYLYCSCFLFLVLESDLECITKLSIVRLQTQLPPSL